MIYDSTDSSNVKSALTANLAAATTLLDAAQSASDRLGNALGTGELAGQGYSAVDALFAQVIAPCIVAAKSEVTSIKSELDTYSVADSKVSQYGVLKEDELKTQLAATKKQRDATEHQIEVNTRAANASTTVPGLADALQVKNTQLELVLAQLEKDVRELEDRVKALQEFISSTNQLFLDGLIKLGAAVGDTVSLLKQLNDGFKVTDALTAGAGAAATRRDILNFLAGKNLTTDTKGRVKWGDRYLYKPKTNNLYDRGRNFNQATKVRIDEYKKPIKAGVRGAIASPVDDFVDWKDASKLGKFAKGAGVAGTVITVGGNADKYFHDGAQGTDVADFAVDSSVDIAGAAAAAGVGAAVGSLILPPAGTIVGALAGFVAAIVIDLPLFGGKSAPDLAKDAIKDAYK